MDQEKEPKTANERFRKEALKQLATPEEHQLLFTPHYGENSIRVVGIFRVNRMYYCMAFSRLHSHYSRRGRNLGKSERFICNSDSKRRGC